MKADSPGYFLLCFSGFAGTLFRVIFGSFIRVRKEGGETIFCFGFGIKRIGVGSRRRGDGDFG
jgi:hypothetical protein